MNNQELYKKIFEQLQDLQTRLQKEGDVGEMVTHETMSVLNKILLGKKRIVLGETDSYGLAPKPVESSPLTEEERKILSETDSYLTDKTGQKILSAFSIHAKTEGRDTKGPLIVETEANLIVYFFHLIFAYLIYARLILAYLIYAAWWVYIAVESLWLRIYCVFSWIKKQNRWWK